MTFLATDYSIPTTGGGYMKLQKGDHVFRALSSAVVGYEYWNTEGKPVRSKQAPKTLPSDIRHDKDGVPEKVKHFWAFAVWNYDTESVELLEVTQATIQSAILSLVKDEDWGDPKQYDIKINRTGDGFETKYTVTPRPKKDTPKEALEAYKETPINLEALFTGDNPFGSAKVEEAVDEIAAEDIPFN